MWIKTTPDVSGSFLTEQTELKYDSAYLSFLPILTYLQANEKDRNFRCMLKRNSRVVEKIKQTWLLQTKFTWLGFSGYDMLIVKQVLHLAVNGLSKQTDDETSSLSKYQFSKSGMSLSRQTDNSPQLFCKISIPFLKKKSA